MDCKIIEDLIIDYMDDNLNKDEKRLVEDHLDKCKNCRNEYEEIKSTIDYLVNSSNNIDTKKEIKLNPKIEKRKSIRNIRRTGFIAIALSFILIISAIATDMFGFIEYWKKFSDRQISAWEQLIENGVGQKLDIAVTDNDVRITAEGVISDELNTIIVLKIEDLKGNNRLTPSWNFTPESRPIFLGGDISNPEGMQEDIPPISNYEPLYADEENTSRLMISTYPLDEEEGNIEIHIDSLVGLVGFYEESDVKINGNWDLTIPVKRLKSKTYNVNKDIDLDGSKLKIYKITFAPTATNVEYTIEAFNKEKDYFISSISFSMKSGRKVYQASELSRSMNFPDPSHGLSIGSYHLQSIYLENPKEIDLIVDTYSASSKGFGVYDIDWDNLPQVVEYKGSKITVEDIEYKDDSTIVTIREDDSKDREYINSNFSFRIKHKKEGVDNGNNYSYSSESIFRGQNKESEVRDSTGKEPDLRGEVWSNEYYQYVFTQEVVLRKDDFEAFELDPEKYDEYLIPGQLYIDNQEYKEFPNSKINIKLK